MKNKKSTILTIIIMFIIIFETVSVMDKNNDNFKNISDGELGNMYYVVYHKNEDIKAFTQIFIIEEKDYNNFLKGEDLYGLELVNFNNYRNKNILFEEYAIIREELKTNKLLSNLDKDYNGAKEVIYSDDGINSDLEFVLREPLKPLNQNQVIEEIINFIDSFILKNNKKDNKSNSILNPISFIIIFFIIMILFYNIDVIYKYLDLGNEN